MTTCIAPGIISVHLFEAWIPNGISLENPPGLCNTLHVLCLIPSGVSTDSMGHLTCKKESASPQKP